MGATIDARILTALRSARQGVSGAELAEDFGISRAAVWARIEELRRYGYVIEAAPHRGYRLVQVPDVLHSDDLLSRLGVPHVVGRDIRVFQETTSTNDVVEKLAGDGVEEGVVVFAETQRQGRGRLGRSWLSSPAQGLWFSVLLRPKLAPLAITRLTVAAATALVRALRSLPGLKCEIKWPNDILVGGRKVAGILTEMTAEQDRVRWVILGVGVNVNQRANAFPPELKTLATSLRLALGQEIDRPALAATVLRELDVDYRRIVEGGFDAVADEWEDSCGTIGRQVVIRIGSRMLRGRAESLDEDGALLLRTEHGHLERITGGDLTVEP